VHAKETLKQEHKKMGIHLMHLSYRMHWDFSGIGYFNFHGSHVGGLLLGADTE
jgi:hypothetical protein